MTLGDLDELETSKLVEALSGGSFERCTVQQIFRATGGNPLFIKHVLQASGDPKDFRAGDQFFATLPLPLPARDVLMTRFRELLPRTRDVLSAAAVLGSEFGVDALALISGIERRELLDSLDEAQQDGFLEILGEDKGSYRFRQTLMRQLIYRDLSQLQEDRIAPSSGGCT